MEIIKTFEELPKWVKLLLLIFVGLISPIYRILRYLESKNTNTLIFAILCFVPIIGIVIQVIDIVSEVNHNRLTFYVE